MNSATCLGKLFIVDDDEQTCDLLKTIAEGIFSIEVFHTGMSFIKQHTSEHDVVLLDLKLPDIDGIEIMRSMAKRNIESAIILMSGYDLGVLHSALKLAKEYGLNVITDFAKPIDISKLVNLLTGLKPKSVLSPLDSDLIQANESFATSQQDEISPSVMQKQLVKAAKKVCLIPTETELLQAIEQRQLVLYYQPQVSLATKKLIGVEALVRWQHPNFGLIYPDQFISLAEKTGLIGKLTAEVIRLAILQSIKWKKQGLAIQISINLSAQNIISLTFPEQLTRLVVAHEIDPSMIKLEVTETALMSEITVALDILTRLRLKGFPLSIDDFGTGYSSLSQLHRAPFSELKIDQSFTMTMLDNPESQAIVETCIMLGHKLNMEVIAEGVENLETMKLLEQLGCDNIQGYYIAKPLSEADFEQWHENYING